MANIARQAQCLPCAGYRVQPAVLVVMRDGEWRSHVCAALDLWSVLTFVDSVDQLSRAAESRTPDVVLWHLDRLVDATELYSAAFQNLRHVAPRSVLIAYGQVDRSVAPLLLVAGRVGADRLLLRGLDDLECGIREALESTRIEVTIRDALRQLDVPSGPAALTLAHCLRRVSTGPLTVRQLADELNVNRKTVGVWLRRAGLPVPEQLISWCRVYWVAQSLAETQHSVGQIARALHFPSESDLRRMVSRYCGCTPTTLRANGGSALIVAALRAHRMGRTNARERAL